MAERLDTASACFRSSGDRSPSALGTQDDIVETLEGLVEDYGLSGYILITVPGETSTDFTSSVLLTSWPEEMLKTYDSAGLVFGSPVIERLRTGTVPFRYDSDATNRRRSDGKAEIAASLFEKYGLSRGAYFPAHNSSGLRGALAFGGCRPALNAREMAELNAVANLIFTRMIDLRAGRPQRAALSRREVECLSWASAGKTSLEMSEILGLSEYTVNHYLNRATRKLDAVNRAQAVAKAVRAGLLN